MALIYEHPQDEKGDIEYSQCAPGYLFLPFSKPSKRLLYANALQHLLALTAGSFFQRPKRHGAHGKSLFLNVAVGAGRLLDRLMRTSSTVKIIVAFAVMVVVIAAQSRTTSRLRRENQDLRGTRERAEETARDFAAATQNVASNELVILSLNRQIDTLQSALEQLRQELSQTKAAAIRAKGTHSPPNWLGGLDPSPARYL